MNNDRIQMPDGRTVGFADFGEADQPAVLWCHGGPGSRLEPNFQAREARAAEMRFIGIDRPGYGHSTPRPERTIAGWVPDALAVADHLGIGRFLTVGVSTGGAYALALAALAPERVTGAVVCCGLTDMAWPEGKSLMTQAQGGAATAAVWAAPDRDTALAVVTEEWGADGSKFGAMVGKITLPAADLALFGDPEWLSVVMAARPEMFAYGMEGYTDDRLADGGGWGTFVVSTIRCPVVVIHGGSDEIVPVAHARHTASVVPHAELRVFDGLGHFSIINQVVATLTTLLAR
jgi:pimeloyl-ACP methyl ester carboxylesterase